MGYTHGVRWSEEKVIEGIKNVQQALSIDRMPSRKEMDEVLGSGGLTNKIAKTGGHYAWANKLNLEIKASDTKTGLDFEDIATDFLEMKGYDIKKMPLKHPYDLLVNDCLKVDVKISRPGEVNGSRVHTFRTTKTYATCDIYMCFALDENDNLERLLIIPGHFLKIQTLCIGSNSQYNKFNHNWDYIDHYLKFYETVI